MNPEFVGWQILTAVVIFGGEFVVWLDRSMDRDHSQMLRAMARWKHEQRLRSRAPDGSGQTGQVAPSGSCLEGVEPQVTRTPAVPPSSAGADAAPPHAVCARRALPVGASNHPADAPTTPTSAGVGRCPHTPAPAGPPRPVRTAVHG